MIYTSGGLDTVGELRDGNDVIIVADDDGDISGGSRNFSVWSMLDDGTYYVKALAMTGLPACTNCTPKRCPTPRRYWHNGGSCLGIEPGGSPQRAI